MVARHTFNPISTLLPTPIMVLGEMVSSRVVFLSCVYVVKTKMPAELAQKVAKLLPKIGNLVADDVPVSDNEDKDNKVVSTFGPTPTGSQYLHHHEVSVETSNLAEKKRQFCHHPSSLSLLLL